MIILRKNKKILELFPIGSSKGALNSRRKPLFYGYLKLKRVGDQLKPYRFIVRKDKEILFPPSESIKILRKQNVFMIGEDPETEEMLNSLNIKFKKTRICKHCTMEGYITIINPGSAYLFQDDYVCRICAEEEIKRELKSRSIDLSGLNNFKRMLNKTKDLNKVLSIFDPNFNPIKNPGLTLYDKIRVKAEDDIPSMSMDEINISAEFKEILKEEGKNLLPVQSLALMNGLLEGENLLVVSATASGKTLIGELAGVPGALRGSKFMFLTPLVALANQKYRDFKKKYNKLELKVAIRVGMSRIKAKEELSIVDDDVRDADIIVGTYEGLDFLLRSGRVDQLGKLGTVVIDEIHMLADEERGTRLNGLIKRLKTLFSNLQIIGLSATIKNPGEIANEFGMRLVEYGERPVPLERHLIYTRTEYEKNDIMSKLAKREYNSLSKKGFHGQSIIFTNSRRKTHTIADHLSKRNVSAAAYHAGLSYAKKNRIEKKFQKQEISAVVTTAALAAGVDFPASQVIFESLIMGNKWLTSNEFSQMLGRAGRPSYHDLGKVYLIPEVGRKFDHETEDMQAVHLLESDVEPINVEYTADDMVEQFLADVCSGSVKTLPELRHAYKNIQTSLDFDATCDIIFDYGLVREKNGTLKPTRYGRAVSMSFLHHEDSEYIHRNMGKLEPLEMVINRDPFFNAYLSNGLNNRLSKVLKINLSSRLFAESTLDILSSPDNLAKLDPNLQEKMINLQMEFFSCECKNRPFCTCFQAELSRKILKYRMQKRDPVDISRKFMGDYEIQAYAGDIFSWLDSVIRMLEAVRRIASAFGRKKVVEECNQLIREIEN